MDQWHKIWRCKGLLKSSTKTAVLIKFTAQAVTVEAAERFIKNYGPGQIVEVAREVPGQFKTAFVVNFMEDWIAENCVKSVAEHFENIEAEFLFQK